jgi:hypothetical protein
MLNSSCSVHTFNALSSGLPRHGAPRNDRQTRLSIIILTDHENTSWNPKDTMPSATMLSRASCNDLCALRRRL